MSRRGARLIKKGIALGLTLVFMAVVRPDPDVSVLGVAFVTLLMYEGLLLAIRRTWRMKRRSDQAKKLKRILMARREMRAVELQRFRRVG